MRAGFSLGPRSWSRAQAGPRSSLWITLWRIGGTPRPTDPRDVLPKPAFFAPERADRSALPEFPHPTRIRACRTLG
jgi:hypothetical protein